MKRSAKDFAASIQQRLLNKSQETGRPFNELLQYYAMERFLYRVSKSVYAEQFVLKGALMLTIWEAPFVRPTRDIDFLGLMENSQDAVNEVIREICSQNVERPDGLSFDPSTIKTERIIEDAEYEGVRIRFLGYLGKSEISMQIDVGFGDEITPQSAVVEYPTVLGHSVPKLFGYNRETTIAEKFQVMVKLGELNSRMRDFYDIWLLSRQFDYEGRVLASAIKNTFSNRRTEISPSPIAFIEAFAADSVKQKQWEAFLRRSRLKNAPVSFQELVKAISVFLIPVILALSASEPFTAVWISPGPWKYHKKEWIE